MGTSLQLIDRLVPGANLESYIQAASRIPVLTADEERDLAERLHYDGDVDAARQHGFHALWANLIDLRWPGDLDKPEHHIHHLRELTDLLPLFDD